MVLSQHLCWEQVFRELGDADEDSVHDALYCSDGSQSEDEEPAFCPSQSKGKARASQRRRLQVCMHKGLVPWEKLP